MKKALLIVAALVAAGGTASALELRAWAQRAPGCPTAWVVVDPSYVPPAVAPQPDPCVERFRGDPWIAPMYCGRCAVAAIPAGTARLAWVATEVWERAVEPTGQTGWTRLTCGAVQQGTGWSFSCLDNATVEQWQGRSMDGLFVGSAAQLDATVRAWWQAQR